MAKKKARRRPTKRRTTTVRVRYRAAEGAQFNDDQAAALGEVLYKMSGKGEDFKPHALVKAARSKRSPVHELFEWDDAVAGEKYRLTQARHHINHLLIVEGKKKPRKAYHSVIVVKDADRAERGYRSALHIVEEKDQRAQVIDTAWSELIGWRRRWLDYNEEFGPIFDVIDRTQIEVASEAG